MLVDIAANLFNIGLNSAEADRRRLHFGRTWSESAEFGRCLPDLAGVGAAMSAEIQLFWAKFGRVLGDSGPNLVEIGPSRSLEMSMILTESGPNWGEIGEYRSSMGRKRPSQGQFGDKCGQHN